MIGCYLISSLRVSDRFQHGGFNLYLTALALFKYSLVLWQQDCITNSWWWWKADRLHERMVALSTPSLSALSSPETLRQRRVKDERKPKKSSSRLFRRGCIKKWRRVSRIISGEYCVNKIFIALKYVLILFLVRKVCLHFKNYFSECVWLLLLVSNYEDLSISKLYEVLPENCKKKKKNATFSHLNHCQVFLSFYVMCSVMYQFDNALSIKNKD